MHRFVVPTKEIIIGEACISGEEFQHLTKVLRLRVGDSVAIFDGLGKEGLGIIRQINKNNAVVGIDSCSYFHGESPLEVWLVQGLAKGEKMDFIIQKATELGVKGIIPLETVRSIVKLEDKKKAERGLRWQKIAQEAAKQCGRTCIPTIHTSCTLLEFIQKLPLERILLVPWEDGDYPFQQACQDAEKKYPEKPPVYIVIGPEGGLAQSEVEMMRQQQGVPITLGPRILRTETAGLATVAVIMSRWGDLG